MKELPRILNSMDYKTEERFFNNEKELKYPVAVCLTITMQTHLEICIMKAPWQKEICIGCLRGWTRTDINGETDKETDIDADI